MKGMVKILLGLVAGFVLLAMLAAVLLPLMYDKADVKRAIATRVQQQTGRDLRIDGALNFSVFPWLAVEVSDLELSNAAGFGEQPFARIGKLRAGVALMPLFRKQLVADELTLDGLQLALAVNAKGQNNWDDLAAVEEDATSEDQPGEETGLFSGRRIAGLNIRDARIEYRDQPAGMQYRMDHLFLKTGALGEAEPVPVVLSTKLEDLVSGAGWDFDLTTKAALDFAAQMYTFEDVELAVTPLPAAGSGDKAAKGEPVVLRVPRVEAGLANESVALDSFTATFAGMEATGHLRANHILRQPDFDGTLQVAEFSPRQVLRALSMEAPVTADPAVLQHARLSASLKGDPSQLSLGDFRLELDQSNFSGELNVADFSRPRIHFDFDVDTIDLDRYLEPAGNGSAEQSDVAMPGEELRKLDVQGTLRVGTLHLAGLEFSGAVVGLEANKGKLRLNPLNAGFYDGNYKGNIQLDSSGPVPVLSLDEKLDSVTFQKLVADITHNEKLSGLAQGHVRLTGRGATSNEVLSSLQGDLGLSLNDGALEGVNLWYEIRRGYALYKGLAPPGPEPARTVFSRMQFDAAVDNGVLTTRELLAELPFLSVRGHGAVNLARSEVDLRLNAIVRNSPELEQDPLAAGLGGMQLPFKVSGSLAGPKVSVDWKRLLKSEATGKLLDKLGLKEQSAGTEQPAGEEESLSGKDQTRKAARGLLFDLLRGKDKNGDKQESDNDGG